MATAKDIDAIAAHLRRQRKNIDEQMESTSVRFGEATELATKIEDLRRRAEESTRRFDASVPHKPPK